MEQRTAKMQKGKCIATFAITLVAAVVAMMAAPSAQAGSRLSSADDCSVAPVEQPFLAWGDPNNYVLVPSGDFESAASGWSLDGAGVVAGNETDQVHGAADANSLSISSGGSATSEEMCVGVDERTLRLFVRSSDPSQSSKLRVEVVFTDAKGSVRSQPMGAVSAGDATSWTPHVPMAIRISSHLRTDQKTSVRFRFTAHGSADWQIDDVYVDPRYH